MAARACTRCAELAATRTSVVFGAGNADADLMFVGEAPGRERGSPGAAVRRRGRQAARDAARRDRPQPRRGLHRERPQVPPARQPRPAARRDRELHALSGAPGRAGRAARDLHARELRDEAAARRPGRHHARARPPEVRTIGSHTIAAVPDLPPGRRAVHAAHARDAARGLPRACPACSRCRRRRPPPRAEPARAGARARTRAASPRPRRRPSSWGSSERDVAERTSLETDGRAATEALGAASPRELAPGDVVHVVGELGAGKTTLVRGACRALGVTAPVTSPTFAIAHRYRGAGGAASSAHLDLYRLERPRRRGSGAARATTSAPTGSRSSNGPARWRARARRAAR